MEMAVRTAGRQFGLDWPLEGDVEADSTLRAFFKAHIENPDPSELGQLLSQAPEALKGFPEFRYASARCDLHFGRVGMARKAFEALTRDSRDARYLHILAQVCIAEGDAPAALAAYLKGLEVAPNSENLRQEFAGLLRILNAQSMFEGINYKRHKLSVISTIKNEGNDILEWLHFHRLVGVEHFYLYDNESSDNTISEISQFPWPDMISLHHVTGEFGQSKAYQHAIDTYRNHSEWCAFIDGDEYLYPSQGNSVPEILDSINGASSVVVHWLNFGSNNLESKPPGLCIESFTRRAPDAFPDHHIIKSIIRPKTIVSYLHPHQSLVLGPQMQDDGEVVYPIAGRCLVPKHGRLRINHYYTKSKQQLMQKRARGRPLAADSPERIRAIEYFTMRDRNDIEDLSIQRFVPALRDAMRLS